VLFYGGKLIHHGHLSSGQLVAFVFYMQSLFSTFSSLGNIYVALVQAVGAADKGEMFRAAKSGQFLCRLF
jgi:ABC-type bacteriocin/lantibiotic exporter with double-glycine peptidase domain